MTANPIANSVPLFFRHSGTGRPVVILHGLFGSSDNWLGIAKVLSNHYSVYLPDQRNHGQSPHTHEHNYTLMAADLAAFLSENQLTDAVLVGHSMGGKTVMKLATTYDIPFYKLVVVDIAPRYYHRHHDVILEGLLSIPLQTLASRQEADERLAAYIPELDVRQFLLKNLYRNTNGQFAWRMNLETINREIENIGEASDEGAICHKPTLFMKGAFSDYIKGGNETLIGQIFPDYRLEVIQSGHWVQAEKPAEFMEALTRFIEE